MRIGAAEAEDAPAPAPAARRDERTRAAAYLDLWERQLTRLAVHGIEPPWWPPA